MKLRLLLMAITIALYPLAAGEGCGGKNCGSIRAADYDQSCSTDTDCVLVSEGDACAAPCSCGNAAINVKDRARFVADFVAKNPASVDCQCRAGAAVCENGKCGYTALGRPFDGG
jgi:hypothetical protein